MFAQDQRGAELAKEEVLWLWVGDTQQQVGSCPTNTNQDRGKILPDADCTQVMRGKHMRSDLWRGAQQKGQQCRQLMSSRTGGMFLEWRVFSDLERYSCQVWSRTGSGGLVTLTNYLNKK